jgi:hypothetical protein
MDAHQLLVMFEDRFYYPINKIVRNVTMDYREGIEANGVVILVLGRIGAGRN